jgi:glycosyltransferase involved in cell wall biosynthesis
MNILQINNYGFVRGGSDRYFIDLSNLLISKGQNISYLISANDKNTINTQYAVNGFDVESPKLTDIPKFFYSSDAQRKLKVILKKNRPDLVHLHIYYGQITSSILSVLKQEKIPVVQTLHEYKLLCPISTMLRDGQLCETCADGGYWKTAWHRCNRGSFARSLVTAIESYISDVFGARNSIDHFIAVSDFVRGKMIDHGVPERKISVVHNFVRDEAFADNDNEGRYFLYFGRVEKIKGLESLIIAMADLPDVDLYVVGSGDARQELELMVCRMGFANIRFLQFKKKEELRELIAGAICVINPSVCFETFGLVLLESFAQSRPVIASRMGGMLEVVTDGEDGLLFEAGDVQQLTKALTWMAAHRRQAVEMGKAGQNKARSVFSADKHYKDIMQVYRKVIGT